MGTFIMFWFSIIVGLGIGTTTLPQCRYDSGEWQGYIRRECLQTFVFSGGPMTLMGLAFLAMRSTKSW